MFGWNVFVKKSLKTFFFFLMKVVQERAFLLFPSITATLNYYGNIVTRSMLFAISLPPVFSKVTECVQLETDLVLSCQPPATIN